MAQRDVDDIAARTGRGPMAMLGHALLLIVRAILDFLNRLGRHWFMLLVLLGGVCLAINGWILLDYGVAFLFREDRPLHGFGAATLLQSPSFISELFAVLLAGAAWVFAVDLDVSRSAASFDPDANQVAKHAPVRFHRELVRLGIRVLLLSIAPLLALLYPASQSIPRIEGEQLQRAVLGWATGLAVTLTVLSVAELIERWLSGFAARPVPLSVQRPRSRSKIVNRLSSWVDWDNLLWRVIILWLMFVATWIGLSQLAAQLPAVAIFALVGLALAAYVALNFLVERMRFYAVIGVLGLAAVIHHGDPFLYRFPGLEKHYAACLNEAGQHKASAATHFNPHWCGKPDGAGTRDTADLTLEDGLGPIGHAVQARDSLKGFKQWQRAQRGGSDARLPKLVVVAISGGAYRAAFWGGLVLDRLREESRRGGKLEGFAQSIRLLTGASGGMVPASYFVLLPPDDIARPGAARIIDQITQDIAPPGETSPTHSRDSLSPIAQQLVQRDFFNAFSPWPSAGDRGVALERQWKRLDKATFATLRPEEEAGRRASLIFAPMIAETGQPLLISNLDLSQISRPEDMQTLELFRALPEAAGELKLSTAVRMSATFPFVTPPASLPTRPSLHVLDAGYLDNYGMGVALGYLKQPAVLDWVAGNTSGVILVQINAFPAKPPAPGAVGKSCQDASDAPADDWVSVALSPLTRPLAGLFSSRGASMRFRNDQEFDTLRQLMARSGGNGRSVSLERVVFENAAHASFSWYLPQQEFQCMTDELETPAFKTQLNQLATFWNAGPLPPTPPPTPALPPPAPATTSTLTPLAAAAADETAPPEPTP